MACMKVKKDALYAGDYHLPDGRVFRALAEEMPHYRQRIKDMLAAGLHIPLSWEHQSAARPATLEEWERLKAQQIVLGFTTGADLSNDGFLESEFEVSDPEDLNRLPKWRYISPKIEHNFRDSTGRIWPGPSITHFAVTPRPVQHNQKPFTLSGETFCLSLAEYTPVHLGETMADEKPEKKEDKPSPKKDDKAPEGDGGKMKKVLQALEGMGIVLGEDTTPENFFERVLVGLETKAANDGGISPPPPEKEEEPSEVSSPVMMSQNAALKKQLDKYRQESLKARIEALTHIPKPIRDSLQAQAKSVQLSFDSNHNLLPSEVESTVKAYELLKGKGSYESVDLSLVEEVDRPDTGADSIKRQEEAGDRLARLAGARVK